MLRSGPDERRRTTKHRVRFDGNENKDGFCVYCAYLHMYAECVVFVCDFGVVINMHTTDCGITNTYAQHTQNTRTHTYTNIRRKGARELIRIPMTLRENVDETIAMISTNPERESGKLPTVKVDGTHHAQIRRVEHLLRLSSQRENQCCESR